MFREGHDQLAAEVVLIGPDRKRRPPVRMAPEGSFPDRYRAWVTPDQPGAWTFEIHSWSDPWATWQHDADIKIRAGVDVELMFTEGRLLLERAARGLPRGDSAAPLLIRAGIDAAKDRKRPVEVRLAALQGPELQDALAEHPLRDLVTVDRPVPGVRRPRARALRQLVRVLPPLRGSDLDPETGERRQRDTAHGRASGSTPSRPWGSTSSTCRRSTRSARSTARAPTTP